MRKTVLLAIGDSSFSRTIRSLLLKHPNYKVVHSCENCEEVNDFIKNCSPDIAILDQNIKNTCSVQLAKELKTAQSITKLVILSTNSTKALLFAAIEHGVLGYISKDRALKYIISCLDKISLDRYFIDPQLFGYPSTNFGK